MSFFFLLVGLTLTSAADVWDYSKTKETCPNPCTVSDKCGINCWSSVNALCTEGTRQSPINVSLADALIIPFQNSFMNSDLSVGCNTWQQGPNGKSYNGYEFSFMPFCDNLKIKSSLAGFLNVNIEEVEEEYVLQQMHIHFPAEHAIGKSSNVNDAELHLVHKSADSKVLVIGVRFALNYDLLSNLRVPANNRPLQPLNDRMVYKVETGQKNPTFQIKNEAKQMLQKINGVFKSFSNPTDTIQVTINNGEINPYVMLQASLPSNNFYVYQGSFTTPPCTEGVTWVFAEDPIEVNGDDPMLAEFIKYMLKGIRGDKGKKKPKQQKSSDNSKTGKRRGRKGAQRKK